MAFHVPRNAGNHPRLFIGGLLVLVIGAAVAAGVLTAEAPRRVFQAEAAAAPPPRPPLVVVEDLPQLKERLDREGAARRFMGAVLVARGDQVLFRQVYGKANYERNEPMRLDTRFRLASDSKQFTAAAILTLQDQGKLSVDDALCDWIQPCPSAWAPVRLHHLLTHQSGIPDLMAQANWGMTRTNYRTKD
ncbi:MAG: class A beta-lactamase-related serine hydrolase, partial [Brevundimonas sp.]